jgi:hypothetical protein
MKVEIMRAVKQNSRRGREGANQRKIYQDHWPYTAVYLNEG